MIYSHSSPISFADTLPDAVDVVVIGGGVIGTSTAWYLRNSGLSVLLCDKGRIAGEQSSRNWGWIRQQGRDAAELPIVMDSINSWASLADEIGEDIGFRRQGVLYAADSQAQLAGYEQWLEVARQHQLDTRMLNSREVDALVPGTPGQWAGGMYTASDGRAEPFLAVPALARALQRQGGLVREQCAVRNIVTQAGRVAGVVTESGSVKTQAVVCAGGAWSSMFMGNLGVRLPQLTVRATVARTEPAAEVYAGNAALAEVAIRRRQDKGYTVASSHSNEHFVSADSFRFFFPFLPALRASVKYVRLRLDDGLVRRLLLDHRWRDDQVSPFERSRVLNPQPSVAALRRMREGLRKRVPDLGEVPFAEAWAGMIDITPDVVPVMDQVDSHPGLFLATGFSGHGFGIGPGAGRIMSALVQGNTPRHDLTRFRLSRFTDGSKIVPGPGL